MRQVDERINFRWILERESPFIVYVAVDTHSPNLICRHSLVFGTGFPPYQLAAHRARPHIVGKSRLGSPQSTTERDRDCSLSIAIVRAGQDHQLVFLAIGEPYLSPVQRPH